MQIKKIIKKLFQAAGYDIIPYNLFHSSNYFLKYIIEQMRINVIIDVGANVGQFSTYFKEMNYDGYIYSFEPLSDAYKELKKNSKNDNKWIIYNCALGSEEKKIEINISKNSQSSSVLEINESHITGAFDSIYIDKENIQMYRLDKFETELLKNGKNIFLKIDTQGYELEVLRGCTNILKYIKIIQLEISFKELYQGAPLFDEVINYLGKIGFYLVGLEKVFAHEQTKELLQVDGIFLKR